MMSVTKIVMLALVVLSAGLLVMAAVDAVVQGVNIFNSNLPLVGDALGNAGLSPAVQYVLFAAALLILLGLGGYTVPKTMRKLSAGKASRKSKSRKSRR